MYHQVIPLVASHLMMKKCYMLPLEKASVLLTKLALSLRRGYMGHHKIRNEETLARLSFKLGIPQTVREKGEEPIFDAARFRASVKTDPTKDIESEREACQVTKANESRQPLNDQQICFEENVTMDQAQAKGGYGVISLFDGVSSVVPTLTRKFGYAPVVQ